MERKKKLRTIQAILLLSGIIIIYFAYSGSKQTLNEKILSEDIKINNNQLSKKKRKISVPSQILSIQVLI